LCTGQDYVDTFIPDFPGIGANEWLCPATDGIFLKVQLVHIVPNIEIIDLDITPDWYGTPDVPLDDLVSFVHQFRELDDRWEHHYEDIIIRNIQHFAGIQTRMIHDICPGNEMLREGCLIIAYALRVLALTHNIMEVTCNLPGWSKENFLEGDMFWEPKELPRVSDMSAKVSISRFKVGVEVVPSNFQSKQPAFMI
jgi:hypothetical protein